MLQLVLKNTDATINPENTDATISPENINATISPEKYRCYNYT